MVDIVAQLEKFETEYYETSDIGILEKMLNLSSEYIKKGPPQIRILELKAHAEFFLDKFDDAKESINSAIKLDPQKSSLYSNRAEIEVEAQIFFEQFDFKVAEQDIEKALSLNRKDGLAYYLRGIIGMYSEDAESSLRNLNLAVYYEPLCEDYRTTRASVLQRLGEYNLAFRDYMKLFKYFDRENIPIDDLLDLGLRFAHSDRQTYDKIYNMLLILDPQRALCARLLVDPEYDYEH